MLLNWKGLCKLLTFDLVGIVLYNHKCFTAFCFFEKIWRISIFSSILKRRRLIWMSFLLISCIIDRCNSFLNNVLNLFIRIFLRRILYIRNSLRVVAFLFTPSIFDSNVNRIRRLQNLIILDRRISSCVSITWNTKRFVFIN